MEALALWLGTLIGAILKQCAPVLVDILASGIRKAVTDTQEDSKVDETLKANLLSKLPPKS